MKSTRTARAIPGALAIALACLLGETARGAETPAYRLNITSQPLDAALEEFGRQSGVQILFFSEVVGGAQAPELNGDFTLEMAMRRLLSRSSLTFRRVNDGTVEIVPRSSSTNRRKKTETPNENGARVEEIVVQGTAEGLALTHIPTPLREIPQTISLVSNEQIRQLNDVDLGDALEHAPGMVMVQANSVDREFFSRGYRVTSYHVDGGAALFKELSPTIVTPLALPRIPLLGIPDLSEFERIEVLRGADTLFAGSGNPGAAISLVRKRPQSTPRLSVSASYGSWDNSRLEVDWTGPVISSGALRARVDALYGDREYFFDAANLDRKRIFGALEYDFTADTGLTLGGSLQRDREQPGLAGLPRLQGGGDPGLPRGTPTSFEWSHHESDLSEGYAQLRYVIGAGWKLKANASTSTGTLNYRYGYPNSPIEPTTGLRGRSLLTHYSTAPNEQRLFSADVTLSGEMEWFGLREQLTAGGDFVRFRNFVHYGDMEYAAPFDTDPVRYDAALFPPPLSSAGILFAVDGEQTDHRYGAFASLRVDLTDDLRIVTGARVSNDRTEAAVVARVFGISFPAQYRIGNVNVITPFYGAMYDVGKNYSVYASRAEIYEPVGQSALNQPLPPARGVNDEIGMKGSWHDGALNGLLALYRSQEDGIPLVGMLQNGLPKSATHHSKGADAELSGAIRQGWLIGAGYAYNVSSNALGGELSTATPRHLVKLWLSAQMPGEWSRVTLGGYLHAQSAISAEGVYCPRYVPPAGCIGANQPFHIRQPSYAVLDLRASVRLDQGWRAGLSVTNALDKVYYQTIGTPMAGNWFGEPRAYLLRVDYSN